MDQDSQKKISKSQKNIKQTLLSQINKIFFKDFQGNKIDIKINGDKQVDLNMLFQNMYQDLYEELQDLDPIEANKLVIKKQDDKLLQFYKKLSEIQYKNCFINCDVKYLNYDLLIENFKNFEVIQMDPPWRIKGGQNMDSSFMFSNCKFNLEYNTMSNNEIQQLPVVKLQKQGFIFMWILNSQLKESSQILQNWGYKIIDILI